MVELNEKALEHDRARLIHILVVHFDMLRDNAEEAADLFLHDKTLPAPDGLAEKLSQVCDGWAGSFAADVACEAATALQSQSEQIERLTGLVSSSEKERYRSCGELLTRSEAAEQQVQKLTAENERLEANIVRLTGNLVDHRYWEGRYRDEKAENEMLKGRMREAVKFLAEGCPQHARLGLVSALETQEGGK